MPAIGERASEAATDPFQLADRRSRSSSFVFRETVYKTRSVETITAKMPYSLLCLPTFGEIGITSLSVLGEFVDQSSPASSRHSRFVLSPRRTRGGNMRFWAFLRFLSATLFQRSHIEGDLDDELRSHIQSRVDDQVRSGVSRTEAERRARIEFGGYERFKEECRETFGTYFLETLVQDIRFGLRMLRKSPGFILSAVLTLPLAIGANTVIFSVVNAVLIRPLPYPEADRLAIIWSAWGKEMRGPASGPELIQLRQRSRTFEEIAGLWVTTGAITGNAEPEQVRLGMVTANFLSLLADKPQLGRLFATGEDRGGSPPMMILADGLWRRQFGANPTIIGQIAHFNGHSFTVVGILPRDFKLIFQDGASVPPDVQVFTPFPFDLEKGSPDQGFIRVIGRLRKGTTLTQAQGEADSISSQLRGEFKDFAEQGLHLSVVSLQSEDVRLVQPALLSVFAAVA